MGARLKRRAGPADCMRMPSGRLALMSVLVLVLAGAGVVLATSGRRKSTSPARASAPTEHEIHTASFKTPIPARWYFVQERATAAGAHGFHLSSTGAPVDGLGIAPKGTAALTIAESAPGVLAAASFSGRAASGLTPPQLLPHLIGQPRGAASVVTVQASAATRLDGAPAAQAAFTYDFQGRPMTQTDVIAERAGRVFTVELDAEPSQGARTALATVLSSWRWR
jgi:hypothetical protein